MKKLMRCESDCEIFGVCSGVARYLNIDTTVVRVVWTVIGAFSGVGIAAYLIAALIMPSDNQK
ncbi:MAG: PspC domain-containing protein [Ruminococcus sp.]|nr:PspC domain-containing protein [Ruminococcus sp.]MCM1381763.1 PspC domain-containing protein [Muribaculaceae bacterium]